MGEKKKPATTKKKHHDSSDFSPSDESIDEGEEEVSDCADSEEFNVGDDDEKDISSAKAKKK